MGGRGWRRGKLTFFEGFLLFKFTLRRGRVNGSFFIFWHFSRGGELGGGLERISFVFFWGRFMEEGGGEKRS